MKRKLMTGAVAVSLLAVLAASGFAVRLETADEALKGFFPDAGSFSVERVKLGPQVIDKVKDRMGGSLVHYQKGSESEKVDESRELVLHYAVTGGKKTGVAIVNTQPGKWGPIEFMIALDPASGKVKDVAVLAYTEKRGRPIARRNFLKQFIGKAGADPIAVDKDIDGISGATISSEAACFAVKSILMLYEEAVLKGGK